MVFEGAERPVSTQACAERKSDAMAAPGARGSAIGGNRGPLPRQKAMPVGAAAAFWSSVWPAIQVKNRSITCVLIWLAALLADGH